MRTSQWDRRFFQLGDDINEDPPRVDMWYLESWVVLQSLKLHVWTQEVHTPPTSPAHTSTCWELLLKIIGILATKNDHGFPSSLTTKCVYIYLERAVHAWSLVGRKPSTTCRAMMTIIFDVYLWKTIMLYCAWWETMSINDLMEFVKPCSKCTF